MAEKWPDKATWELLRGRAGEDQDAGTRSAALQALMKKRPDGLSSFGKIVITRDLNGRGPYLDPLQPIPREHMEQAATDAGIAAADLDAEIASLNQHLGWDITVGARSAAKAAPKKRRRKSK